MIFCTNVLYQDKKGQRGNITARERRKKVFALRAHELKSPAIAGQNRVSYIHLLIYNNRYPQLLRLSASCGYLLVISYSVNNIFSPVYGHS